MKRKRNWFTVNVKHTLIQSKLLSYLNRNSLFVALQGEKAVKLGEGVSIVEDEEEDAFQ